VLVFKHNHERIIMKLQNKILLTGGVLVGVFNPLSVNLWGDGLDVLLNIIVRELINISIYTMVVGATLIAVGFLLHYVARTESEKTRLKNLGKKKTATPKYIDIN